MDFLLQLDKDIFLYLNSIHSPIWDIIMHYVSGKLTWAPLYLTALFFIFKQFKLKKGILILVSFGLVIILADQISVQLFKNVFERLRPCHNPEIIDIIHCPRVAGGKFGFVSSHAANSFAFASLSALLFRKSWYSYTILIWASVVAYSRIYLGVHYPADIVFGGILGGLIGIVVYKLYSFIEQRTFRSPPATQAH